MTIDVRPSAAQRVLVGTDATLTSYKLDQYGEPVTTGSVTVVVTRADDSVLESSGTATRDTDTNQLSYQLAAAGNTRLDWLKAVWTDNGDSTTWSTYYDVVGGFYSTIAEIRARDPNLNDAGKYPDGMIRSVLEEIETAFEIECGRAFVPRFGRARLTGTDRDTLVLPDTEIRSIRSVGSYSAYDPYTLFAAADLDSLEWYRAGVVRRFGSYWYGDPSNYVIEYEHGMDRPPVDVKTAVIRWLRSSLNTSRQGFPDRAYPFSGENVIPTLIVPGRDGAVSAIPEVDAVIDRYRIRRFTVGV